MKMENGGPGEGPLALPRENAGTAITKDLYLH
jgi:hypothetical protein